VGLKSIVNIVIIDCSLFKTRESIVQVSSEAQNDRQIHSWDPNFGQETNANSNVKHQQITSNHHPKYLFHDI